MKASETCKRIEACGVHNMLDAASKTSIEVLREVCRTGCLKAILLPLLTLMHII